MKTTVSAAVRFIRILCVGVLIWSLIGSFTLSFWMTGPFILVSLAGAFITLRWGWFKASLSEIWNTPAGHILLKAAAVLIGAVMLYITVISGLMIGATTHKPDVGATLIILGCQVRGETPSLMLTRRMEAALLYLRDNPNAVCVLSGGQGATERISEAECMRRYLTAHGISESRLFLEEQSTSTYENITFSEAIIAEHDLPRSVAIATDGFHQFRAQSFSENAGLDSGAVVSHTPVAVLPFYWLREVMANTSQTVIPALF